MHAIMQDDAHAIDEAIFFVQTARNMFDKPETLEKRNEVVVAIDEVVRYVVLETEFIDCDA